MSIPKDFSAKHRWLGKNIAATGDWSVLQTGAFKLVPITILLHGGYKPANITGGAPPCMFLVSPIWAPHFLSHIFQGVIEQQLVTADSLPGGVVSLASGPLTF